jgi:bacterioferritin
MTVAVRTQKHDHRKNELGRSAEGSSTSVDRKVLIEGLNDDLAGEYQAILMYTHYSAKLTGPYRRELRALFQAEIADEQGHAQFLADKIAALGGEPTTEPRPVPHANQPRQMLEHALAAEVQAITGYNQRLRQAEASATSVSRWTWKIRSPTRPGTRKNLNASSPVGTNADRDLESGGGVRTLRQGVDYFPALVLAKQLHLKMAKVPNMATKMAITNR